LGADYLTLVGKAIKLHGGLIQTDPGKKAPAHPRAMFVDPSLITGKAPLAGQSDRKSWNPPFFYWKTGGWNDVNSSRFVADPELAAQIRGARKIVRAPGRLALSKNMGNGDGAIWISSIEPQPRRLKMTMPNGGAKLKFRQRIIGLH